MKTLKEERAKYRHRAVELDKRLAEAKKGLKSRDGLIESLEDTQAQLKEELHVVRVSMPGVTNAQTS